MHTKKKSTYQMPEKSTILVADDNPVIMRLLTASLSKAGYLVIQAEHGQQALDLLQQHHIDLVLLDIDMPGLTGLETCRTIKADPDTADIPVLFITARRDTETLLGGFAAGAQDYIIKPSTREEILTRVRTHLALSRSHKELRASWARYRELSYQDDLTGLFNTRYLYKALQAQLTDHPDQPVTAAFLDIDSFKQVVDTHGHLNGSQAIAELAAIVHSLLPDGSFGVSYGGDELVLILKGLSPAAARRTVENIRSVIAEAAFLVPQTGGIRLSVSCGLASFPEDAFDLTSLLGNADQALFAAKGIGKNRVLAFAELSDQTPPCPADS